MCKNIARFYTVRLMAADPQYSLSDADAEGHEPPNDFKQLVATSGDAAKEECDGLTRLRPRRRARWSAQC